MYCFLSRSDPSKTFSARKITYCWLLNYAYSWPCIWRQYVPLLRQWTIGLHGVTAQNRFRSIDFIKFQHAMYCHRWRFQIKILVNQSVQRLSASGKPRDPNFESRQVQEFSPLHVVKTGCEAHATSYPMGTGN
jgi:hypothetical protein